MNIRSLPIKNLKKKPGRTAVLLILVIFLSFAVFAGSVTVSSLGNGLSGLERRLGADIIVVPSSARSHVDLEQMLLSGTPGYFYMDKSNLGKVLSVEGVEKASPQYFMASVKAGCCSLKTQIIGFDPDTDFSVTPWISESYQSRLETRDVVVGSDITVPVGGRVRFYDVNCNVVAKLAPTGTGLDTAVYANDDTVKILMQAAADKGMAQTEGDPDTLISAIYIKVADGYDVQTVADYINIYMKKVEAVPARSMLSGISDSLSGISDTIKLLVAAVWILAFVIMIIVFSGLVNERKKEFAVLRVVGMSRKMLSRLILTESLILSVIGGVIGIALGAAVVFPFSAAIEARIGLPFLTPGAGTVILLAALSLVAALVAGPAASAYSAYKLSRVDTGVILREGM